MRTTIDISDDLYQKVKTRADERGVGVSQLVEEGLHVLLHESTHGSRRVEFPIVHKGATPGISQEEVDRVLGEEFLGTDFLRDDTA